MLIPDKIRMLIFCKDIQILKYCKKNNLKNYILTPNMIINYPNVFNFDTKVKKDTQKHILGGIIGALNEKKIYLCTKFDIK